METIVNTMHKYLKERQEYKNSSAITKTVKFFRGFLFLGVDKGKKACYNIIVLSK